VVRTIGLVREQVHDLRHGHARRTHAGNRDGVGAFRFGLLHFPQEHWSHERTLEEAPLPRKSYFFPMRRIAVAGLFGLFLSTSSASGQIDWRPGATCYEVFIRSFYDSDGDGIGDLKGLIQKLDYINDTTGSEQHSLGARCIWLMPVAESPSYHGYDVTNYYRVDPDYGTNEDFKKLIAAAHRRDIRVLVDLVLNHMSSEHPFFQEALNNPASPYRNWFRWSATKRVEKNWGQEVWHHSPVRDEWYYGLFWGGMPDLNYETQAVRDEAKKVARFWLQEMGVDGFRLDAIPYLVEENDQLVHTAGTHALLREFAAYMRAVAPNAFTIGEVTYPIDAMLSYYPDQLDAYFAFDVADSIIAAVRKGSAKGLFPPVLQLQRAIPAVRWSPFLRNHDQTRTMTELGGSFQRARLAATLLMTFPGLPFVYYGEEIGMTGDKPDPRLRTPMHWTRGKTAGFTAGTPWESLQPDSLTANVALEDADRASLLNLYRRLIHLRASNPAIGSGELVPLVARRDAAAAYLRRTRNRTVLVVANLGSSSLSALALQSRERLLPPGLYTLKDLLGTTRALPLRIRADGRIRAYAPLTSIAPMESHVFELSRRIP
jgi:alpha-amylase